MYLSLMIVKGKGESQTCEEKKFITHFSQLGTRGQDIQRTVLGNQKGTTASPYS